jgi:hypothetical protein
MLRQSLERLKVTYIHQSIFFLMVRKKVVKKFRHSEIKLNIRAGLD